MIGSWEARSYIDGVRSCFSSSFSVRSGIKERRRKKEKISKGFGEKREEQKKMFVTFAPRRRVDF